MERRSFIQKIGLGVGYSVMPEIKLNKKNQTQVFNPYLTLPGTIEEAKSREGLIMVRIAIEGNKLEQNKDIKGSINIKNGEIERIKSYFFEPGFDEMEVITAEYNLATHARDYDVIVVWIQDPKTDTEILYKANKDKIKFNLGELLDKPELKFENNDYTITCNLLFDKEIGKISPEKLGINESKDNFRFVVMADPQGGEPDAPRQDSSTRVKIHNAFVEESIKRCNELDPQPEFTIVIGDYVDSKGQMENFLVMNQYFKELKSPFLVEAGNHESEYSARFSPGYNHRSMDNFFTAQKEMNGLDKLLYSFDLGKWHFVVWPDPLRSTFWQCHPHYFDWLERDLEAHKDRPTIVLQHVPVHPIGINPLINYAETVEVKRTFIDILSKNGNVKYVLSGHVHIPVKSSVKTAVEINGIQFINLPAAGYRPRAFGEEDYYGGPTQGIVYGDIKGEEIDVYFQNVTRETFKYPKKFKKFDQETYPLWLNHKWELNSNDELVNGDFSKEMDGWAKRYVYTEDENPSNLCEIRKEMGKGNSDALYIYSRKRGYDAPGQDRLPQTINRICQVVNLKQGQYPTLSLTFKIDKEHFNPEYLSGAYFWIEGFQKSFKRLNLCYSVGKMYMNIGGNQSQLRTIYPAHFDLPVVDDNWNEVKLNLAMDHENNKDHLSFIDSKMDKLAINIGTWTINDGYKQECGIYVDNVSFSAQNSKNEFQSQINGQNIQLKEKDWLIAPRIGHVSGEHQYGSQKELYPKDYPLM